MRINRGFVRHQVYLDPTAMVELAKLTKPGVCVADLVRRSIQEYVKRNSKELQK